MSYCTNCGRQILDESLGCPVCNVRNNIDPSKPVIEAQVEDGKEPVQEETVEKVEAFTVEESNGRTHHFESSAETGEAEYRRKATVAEDAKIHPALKVLIIVLIIMVGGFGAIAGCVAGVALSKSPSEDYRKFGKLMMTVSVVMLVLSLLCCMMGTGMGVVSNLMYY